MVDTIRQKSQLDGTVRLSGELPHHGVPPTDMTPKDIVAELDKYIIGQTDAKRAVAVALRNRYRRQLLSEELRREVQPKNILMIGSTGVGKTEIARRVSRIVDAPFIKVEATKFTEVGYVGRDVESIIRDLVEIAISHLHGERMEQVKEEAAKAAMDRLASILAEQQLNNKPRRATRKANQAELSEQDLTERNAQLDERRRRRERKRVQQLLDQEAMEDETVEIEVEEDAEGEDNPPIEGVVAFNADELHETLYDFLDGLLPRRSTRRRVSVREARRILAQQEANRLVDIDEVIEAAMRRVEDTAVVFIDEIDKTISSDEDTGPDASGEGVQRDLLPIVEGSAVMTRYGPVITDHILFIAAGSFLSGRPSDLIPELQGRFPIRVELHALTEDDLFAILTEPRNALTKQYQALLETEGVTIHFPESGLREIARLATIVNTRTEDIGARRLLTIMEKVLEDLSFDAPDLKGQEFAIDAAMVAGRAGDVVEDEELSAFIL